jgi:hypothetical protein
LFALVLCVPHEFVSLLALVEQLPTFSMQPLVLLFKLISLP